jgi:hypothetical protein
MQSAIDNAALMLSKDAPNLTSSEITVKAQAYFTAILKRPDLANLNVTATYSANTGKGSLLDMAATGQIATTFMKIAGFSNLALDVSSTVAWGNTRIQVALALDSTGSMADKGKMPAMQAAAKKLIDQLAANAKKPGDLYVSMIPFSTHVNVGPANYQQPWFDWRDWEDQNGTCSSGGSKTGSDCTSKGRVWTSSNHSNYPLYFSLISSISVRFN